MLQGHQYAPARAESGPPGHRPAPSCPADLAMPHALLPAARWVCGQTASSPLDAGLASRAAREFTGQVLYGWGLLTLTEDAAVIVSELVVNALRHGLRGRSDLVQAQVELIWWRRTGQVICMVTDPGADPPVVMHPDPLAETGRGLHVVDALSDTWGWTRLGGRRKAVWAALPVPGAEVAGGHPSWYA